MQGKTDEALASSSSVARPVLLLNSIGPCRAQLEPGLRELACLDPVELHARPSASLAGAWVRPHQRKTEPRAIPGNFMVVHNEARIRPVLTSGAHLRRILLRRHLSSARFIVADADLPRAFGNKVVLALMPYRFPSVEEIAHAPFKYIAAFSRKCDRVLP
jgi:hypothetical protein